LSLAVAVTIGRSFLPGVAGFLPGVAGFLPGVARQDGRDGKSHGSRSYCLKTPKNEATWNNKES